MKIVRISVLALLAVLIAACESGYDYRYADPSVGESGEIYWKTCRPKAPSAYAQREDEAARLWALPARLCGVERTPAS